MQKPMNSFFLFGIFFLLQFSCAAGILAENGRALVDIAVNGEKSGETEKTAAKELQLFLEQATGAKFTIRDEKSPGKKDAIYIGDTDFAGKNGIDMKKADREEWLIRLVGDSLVIAGGVPRGTLYGVYDFLEKYLDAYFLDCDCTTIRKTDKLEIPGSVSIRKKPAFYSRYTVPGGLPDDMGAYSSYLLRNRSNFAYIPDSFGGVESYGSPGMCHTFYEYSKEVPKDKTEYFSLRSDGFRERAVNSGGPGQLCITNPEVCDLVYRKLVSYIEADRKRSKAPPRFYSITGNDNVSFCKCGKCMEYTRKGGNYSDTTVQFINKIAARLKKSHPDVKVITWAYTYTIQPPKFEKPLDNVIVELCNLGKEFTGSGISETMQAVTDPQNKEFHEIFTGWAKISRELFVWDYWILYCKTSPFPYLNTERYFTDMKFFEKNGVRGMLVENETSAEAFSALRQWLSHRLLLDPYQDREKLLGIFFGGYYGKAAEPMRKYFDMLEECSRKEPGSFAMKQPVQITYLTPEFLDKADELLDLAEKTAGDPAVVNRIRLERIPLDSARLELNLFKDRESLLKRLDGNMNLLFAQQKTKYPYSPESWKERMAFLKLNIQVPQEFQGRKATDFTWMQIRKAPQKNVVETDDPEAVGGKAVRIGESGPEKTHKLPFLAGVYNIHSKQFGPVLRLNEFPQDEKYHLFKVGRFDVMPGTIFHAPWTWASQTPLDRANPGLPENICDIYVSLKFTGPLYVKDSKKENAVYMDRILVVKE